MNKKGNVEDKGGKGVSKDYILFIMVTVLMAIHVVYGTLQIGASMLFSFSVFIFPYVVVCAIWFKLKEIGKLSVIIVFLILELNHLVTGTIPELMNKGLNHTTLNAIFYFPSILLLVVILLLLVSHRVREKKDEKNKPYM
jgi:hypothetical protein